MEQNTRTCEALQIAVLCLFPFVFLASPFVPRSITNSEGVPENISGALLPLRCRHHMYHDFSLSDIISALLMASVPAVEASFQAVSAPFSGSFQPGSKRGPACVSCLQHHLLEPSV